MIDEKLARLRAHRNNIRRYRRLLNTRLSDLEREFLLKRLLEEQSAIDALSAAPPPFSLKWGNPPSPQDASSRAA